MSDNTEWLVIVTVDQTLADVERQVIEATMQRNNGNKLKTAVDLGICRKTLYNKLNSYTRGTA